MVNPQRDPRNGEVAEAIQAQLRAVGVDMKVHANEFATYMKILQSPEGDYNMIFHGYGVATADADLKATFFLSTNLPPAGQNSPRFASPELDGVILAAQRESNKDKRRELYCKMGQIYRDQALGLPLYASFRNTSAQRQRQRPRAASGRVVHADVHAGLARAEAVGRNRHGRPGAAGGPGRLRRQAAAGDAAAPGGGHVRRVRHDVPRARAT